MRAYRKEKVASAIRQVIGEAILHKLNDPRIATMTTVTRVEMSADLLIARVFLSVVGSATEESQTLRAIRHAGGFLQRQVASAVSLRNCPELRFETDERVKGVKRTMEILNENLRQDPSLAELGDQPDSDKAEEEDELNSGTIESEPTVGDRP